MRTRPHREPPAKPTIFSFEVVNRLGNISRDAMADPRNENRPDGTKHRAGATKAKGKHNMSSFPLYTLNGNRSARPVVRGASIAHRRKLTKSQRAVLAADILDGRRIYQPTRVDLALRPLQASRGATHRRSSLCATPISSRWKRRSSAYETKRDSAAGRANAPGGAANRRKAKQNE